MILIKSALYRQEIKQWILIIAIVTWALVSTVFAVQNRRETLIIGIDDAGTRLITSEKDRLFASELKNFLRSFLDHYYSYDEVTFEERTGIATEWISQDLWDKEKEKLLTLEKNLKAQPLKQTADVESIDLLESGQIEAVLVLKIRSRMVEQKVRLKVRIEYRKIARSDRNQWGFEITELSDAVL